MSVEFLLKRGLKADLPASAPEGEPLLTTDTHELYVGTGDGIAAVTSTATSVQDFLFTQGVPSAVWVITHNMDKNPSVVIADSTGRVVYGDIVNNSANQLTITFAAAFAGTASLS